MPGGSNYQVSSTPKASVSTAHPVWLLPYWIVPSTAVTAQIMRLVVMLHAIEQLATYLGSMIPSMPPWAKSAGRRAAVTPAPMSGNSCGVLFSPNIVFTPEVPIATPQYDSARLRI